jgi:hypothetical protein
MRAVEEKKNSFVSCRFFQAATAKTKKFCSILFLQYFLLFRLFSLLLFKLMKSPILFLSCWMLVGGCVSEIIVVSNVFISFEELFSF